MSNMCFTCCYGKRLKSDPDYWYCTGQNGSPRVYDPSNPTCGNRYRSMFEAIKEGKNNMIVSPFKEISVPKTVFNEDYWKVGDAYVIKTPNTKPKFYILAEVVETSYVLMDNGTTLSPEDFNSGHYELINHISLDYACSKSIAVG